MKFIAIFLIIFGVIIIRYPEMLAYLIGGFFVFIGINMLFVTLAFKKKWMFWNESYVKFGKYKIYR